MSSNFLEYVVARNAKMQALADLLDGGKLKFYAGFQPASENPIVGTLIAEMDLPTPSGSVSGGILTFGTIPAVAAVATERAGFGVLQKADGTTIVATGSVGTSDADFILTTLDIVLGKTVTVAAATLTAPV